MSGAQQIDVATNSEVSHDLAVTVPAADDSSESLTTIQGNRVEHLCKRAVSGLVGYVLLALLTGWMLWPFTPGTKWAVWAAAVAGVIVGRGLLLSVYSTRHLVDGERHSRWFGMFMAVTVLSGLGWSSAGILAAHHDSPDTLHVMLLVVASACIIGITGLAASLAACVVYILATLLPLGVTLVGSSSEAYVQLGWMCLVFMFCSLVLAHSYSRDLAQRFVSANENKSLKADLIGTQEHCEQTSATLRNEVAAHKQTHEKLRASSELDLSLRDSMPVMFFHIDAEGVILTANQFCAEQIGYRVCDLTEMSFFMLHSDADKATVRAHLAACFRYPQQLHRWEIARKRKDGSMVWVREAARVVNHTDVPSVLIVSEDISDARTLSEQLSFQATHDSLTGLVSRGEFEGCLQRALSRVWASGGNHALCYLDLDQFKVINDTCGHFAGDELLRQLAALLSEHLRKNDTLARLGGDEFGVLLENCSLESATVFADTLRQVVEDMRFHWEGKTFSVGISVGVVSVNENSDGMAALLSAADSACYAAKEQGRNRVHVYDEEDATLAKRHGEMQWVSHIQSALEEHRFQLSEQLIVPVDPSVEEGEHYELLVRMLDEDGQLIPPGAFLPAAERYNLSTSIDRWVVAEALRVMVADTGRLERLSACAINLSAHSFSDKGFYDFVVDLFEKTNVPPHKICFEVTETAAIANLSVATQFIVRLKGLGCHFSLDDFGSGFSSFAYLKALPVDYIKIDGIFVKDIDSDPIDYAMVRSINDVGHVMGKKTIAEFVENDAILARLREIGVDYAQGYGIAKPKPIIVPITDVSEQMREYA